MIKVRFLYSGSSPCGFEISGHAGYAGKGHDIVCASVSSAIQMSANTITEVIGVGAHIRKTSGRVTFRLIYSSDSAKNDAASSVIKGLRLHLSILSTQYRGTISIEDSEV